MNAPRRGWAPLLAGALGLSFISFVSSALVNVLPQLYFRREAPEWKEALLSGTLLVGTLSSVLGVWLSSEGRPGRLAGRGATVGAICVAALGVAILVGAGSAALFVALSVVLRLVVSFGTNLLDRRVVGLAGPERRVANDRLTTLARLVGIVLAPPLFAAWFDAPQVLLLILSLSGAVAAAAAWLVSGAGEGSRAGEMPGVGAPPVESGAALDGEERAVFTWMGLVYCAMYILGPNIYYLLGDHLGRPDSEGLGAAFVLLCFVSAAVAVMLSGLRGQREASPWMALGLGSLLFAVTAELCLQAWIRSASGILGAAVLIGLAYGWMLMEVRAWATARDQAGGSRRLTLYNNLANLGMLAAMTVLLGLSLVAGRVGWPYHVGVLRVVELVCLGGLPLYGWRRAGSGVGFPEATPVDRGAVRG